MKPFIICMMAAAISLSGCTKAVDALLSTTNNTAAKTESFTKYTIPQGEHYADKNSIKFLETSEMKFAVKFDSTAIYQSQNPENQYDINKLYGFSDNGADHHQFSARIGWSWTNNALRLYAYVYNNGVVSSKEMGIVSIGNEIECSIKVTDNTYVFTAGEASTTMPRLSTTPLAKGYQLYPYFGGDEVAPHAISIWIKNE